MGPRIYNIIFALYALILVSCQASIPMKKINGISLVASRDSLKTSQIAPVMELNSNAVALMPFAFVPDMQKPKLIYDMNRQWYGETSEGIEQAINILKKRNLKLMIKPQIWIRNGEFTGDLEFRTEADWRNFEEAYRAYILPFAKIAEKHQVQIFCVGTELFNFVEARPEFWKQLIREIRTFYKGEVVYAENWDKAAKTDIWQDLDYIGVDAYFPLSDKASPDMEELLKGWEPHKELLEELSRKFNKPILFTEYGYRNIDFATRNPWNSSREITSINHELQATATAALFETFWNENWFAGGFLWKWHQSINVGGLQNNRFTPQNKPAEKIIKEHYGAFRN